MPTFGDIDRRLGLIPAAIARQLSQIDIARGRQEAFARQHPAQLDALRQTALIESVTASNAIERITAPRRRVEALVTARAEPRNRSEAEIAGYRAALDMIHSSATDIPFTPNVVLQLHRDLYQFTGIPGGRWKSADNTVTEELPDGTIAVRFTPVSAFETPRAMDDLHSEYADARSRGEHHPLLLVAAYILDFLVIHPFADGNGRMSRLLSLLALYQAAYEVGRFVSLERIVEETKETYYDGLARSTEGWHEGTHDLQPWASYFLGVLVHAYTEFERQAEGMTRGRGAKAALVKTFIRSNVSDVFSFADVKRAAPGVSDEYIREVLRELRDAGMIERIGAGRATRWRRLHVNL